MYIIYFTAIVEEHRPLLEDQNKPEVKQQDEPDRGEPENENPNVGDRATCNWQRVWVLWIALITDWPLKIAVYISGALENNEQQNFPYSLLSCLQWFYVWIRLVLAIIGLFAQAISCFRRDRLDQNVLIPEGNNASKLVECFDTSQLFSDIFIPDLIIMFILIWLLIKKFFGKFCRLCRSITPADKGLNNLVNKIKQLEKKPDIWMSRGFPLIPILYVVYSLGASLMNWRAFDIADDDVVIQKHNISGPFKTILLFFTFLGFVALDLLYTQLIMMYAFQCKMNIYFLENIKNNVDIRRYKNQDEAFQDLKQAREFIKHLNKNSAFVGLVILITTIQTINSIISLNNVNNFLQLGAIAARLLQWIFLTLFPIYQAAQVNDASKSLRETGLAMYRLPVMFKDNLEFQNTIIRKYASPITLKAKLFGFTIHPWLFYLLVILILFTLMVGSGFKWYERLL